MDLPIYDALPPKHFRLLKITEKRGIINASLTTFSLDGAPGYVALSYTWAEAEDPCFSLEPVAARSLPCKIVLNGQIREITSNLQDFFSLAIQLDGIHETWFWIDAICIDQTNTPEKTNQVNMMGKIYSQADLTFVWLGKSDSQTEKTQSMIHKIGQKLKQRVGHVPANVLNDEFGRVQLDSEDYLKRMGLDISTTWEDWLGLVRFLQRRWFRRVWTIQEVALAENALIRCGPYIFDWHDMLYCSWALSNTPLGAVLRTRAEKHFGTYRINFMFGIHAFMNIAVHKPGDLATTQAFAEWNIEDKPEYGPVVTWARLINFMRHSGATDPRDRIFALGGIWERLATDPLRSALMRPADYNKSVQTVFIEAMTDLLDTTSCLNFLSLVQPGEPVTPGLPSWVADYAGFTATPIIQFMAINEMLDSANASRNTSEPAAKFHISSNKLFLSTVKLGTITDVSDSWAEWSNGQFLQTLEMLCKSSKVHPDKQAVMDAFCLLLLFDMSNTMKRPEPEVFWNFFLQILLSHLTLKAQRNSTIMASLADIGLSLDTLAKSDALHRIPTLNELALTGEKLLVWDNSGCRLETNELDQIRSKSYELRLILLETMYGRRTFLMDTGHFGITAEDVKPGDTIRIVPGARALFTFRTAKGLDPQNEHQGLIGEAYVSGMMGGEAIEYVRNRGGKSKWEEICVI